MAKARTSDAVPAAPAPAAKVDKDPPAPPAPGDKASDAGSRPPENREVVAQAAAAERKREEQQLEADEEAAFKKITGRPGKTTVRPPGAAERAQGPLDGDDENDEEEDSPPDRQGKAERAEDEDRRKPKEATAPLDDQKRARYWCVKRFGMVPGVFEKLTPAERVEQGKRFEEMQAGIDRARTRTLDSAGRAAQNDPHDRFGDPARVYEDVDDEAVQQPAQQRQKPHEQPTQPVDLTPSQKKAIEKIIDPDDAEEARKEFLAENEAAAKGSREREQAQRNDVFEQRRAVTHDRLKTAREIIVEDYPELKDDRAFLAAVKRADAIGGFDLTKGLPKQEALEEALLAACKSMWADKRLEEFRATAKAQEAEALDGQLARSDVSSASDAGSLDPEEAAFRAVKDGGGDEGKVHRTFERLTGGRRR